MCKDLLQGIAQLVTCWSITGQEPNIASNAVSLGGNVLMVLMAGLRQMDHVG